MPKRRPAAGGAGPPGRHAIIEDRGGDASQEDPIGRPSKPTLKKRDRERAKQVQQKEKEARREQRKADKITRPVSTTGGDDPDLAGLVWGPQAPLY